MVEEGDRLTEWAANYMYLSPSLSFLAIARRSVGLLDWCGCGEAACECEIEI